MHLDSDHIQRLIDGELAPAEARDARVHVGVCAPCRRLADAAAEDAQAVSGWLTALDDPAPAIRFETIATRAAARRARWTRNAVGWVAAAVIATVAIAAPGSPVRNWMGSAVLRVTGAPRPSAVPAPEPETDGAGIAVDPGPSFVIEIRSHAAGGALVVRWTDDDQVAVRTSRAGAAFTSRRERLTVALERDSVVLEIAIPRSAPRVEIRSGERMLWLGQEGRAAAPAAPGPDGTYRIGIDAP